LKRLSFLSHYLTAICEMPFVIHASDFEFVRPGESTGYVIREKREAMSWYLEVLRKYAQFSGRARRKEYWFFALFNVLVAVAITLLSIGVVLLTVGRGDTASTLIFIPVILYWFAILVPAIAVTVRRLHDTGRSGWWYFVAFVPFVGGFILLIFTLMEGTPGPNMYGSSPKSEASYAPVYQVPAGF
jgi:uncharacterized membrane protein YhaH (DUF805 family)